MITNDDALAERVRRLRNGGQSERAIITWKRASTAGSTNLQAAVLRARLPLLARLDAPAPRAGRALSADAASIDLRTIRERDPGHVYHLFPVRAPEREALQAHLASAASRPSIHYPVAAAEAAGVRGVSRRRSVRSRPPPPRTAVAAALIRGWPTPTSCAWPTTIAAFQKGHRPA